MSTKKTLFNITYTLLRIPGLQLKDQNRFANIRLAVSFLVFLVIAILSAAEVAITYRNVESLGKAEVFPIYIKNALSIWHYHTSKANWKKLTEDIDRNFWDWDDLDLPLSAKHRALTKKVIRLVKCYMVLIFSATLFYFTKPAFLGLLPFYVYNFCDPENYTCYCFIYTYQSLSNVINLCVVLGYDVLLIYQVACVYLEFDAVDYYLKRIDFNQREKVVEDEIYKLIEHHGVILDVTSSMREIWSGNLLMLYWMSTCSICLGFFLMNINGIPPSFDDFTKYSNFIFAFATELLIYCIAGTVLMEKSTSVSKTAFEINWWIKTQPNVRRALTMMIQRANKPGKLDVGGVSALTLAMFPQILRTSFSFFTLMQNLGEGKNHIQ